MKKIFIIILCCFGVLGIFDYGCKFHHKYIIKQNMHEQTSPYNDNLVSFCNWSVTQKEVTKFALPPNPRKTVGALMSTPSLSSTKNNIKSQFFASIHTLSASSDHHYTDLFLSVYYPQKFNFFDFPPSLYYSIDNEVPILTRIQYWETKNNVLYFAFRPNVYDFMIKCSNANTITFTIIDWDRKTIHESFSLKSFASAHKFSVDLLKKIYKNYSKN